MAESASAFTSNLAVVYLARFAEGSGPVANFIDSYNRHEAGIAHDRVVVRKGFSHENTKQDKILRSLFPNIISLSDEGFDITAFAKAAAQLPHKHVVFLNTFSEIVSDHWLAKLGSTLSRPEIGLVGTTGSYESLHSSVKRFQEGLFQKGLLRSPLGARRLLRTMRQLLPKRFVNRLVLAVIARSARSNPAVHDRTPDDRFEAFWKLETRPGGRLDYLNAIPLYPNAHIRTNAFMIERETFLDTLPSSMTTKNDTFLYESGPNSLTQQILRRGKQVVIVGHDGQSYGIDQWPKSETFRLGDQHNLLVQDNQTRAFAALNRREKRVFVEMTWGEDMAQVTELS
jgi:hypothetical protein